MRKVLISNSILQDDTYKTNLSAAYSSGTSLSVLSSTTFAANDELVVGQIGEELAELKKCTAVPTDTTITLASALKFSHSKDTPVYKVAWDMVEIEGKATAGGAFATLTQSAIQWDKKDTIYYHSAGTSDWYYRYKFYNSVTLTYSEYSPTITGAGYTRPSLGFMITEIRKIVQDVDRKIVTDTEIMRFINAAQDIISGVRSDWWFLKTEDSAITTTGGTRKYALPTGVGNLGTVESIRYNYDDGTSDEIYHLKYLNVPAFDYEVRNNLNTTDQQDDHVEYYTLRQVDSNSASGYFEVAPTPLTTARGTFYIRYFKEMTDLDDVADETSVPIPQILENYAIAQVYKILGKEDLATYYDNLFWGPPGEVKGRVRLSGISLLEQLNKNQKRPSGQPRSLWEFSGQNAIDEMFNNRVIDRDDLHENYW